MLKSLFVALALAFGAAPAFAAGYIGVATFYTKLHFSEWAWDKQVREVSAHIGVLTASPSGERTYWTAVTQVPLRHANGRFSNWAVLHGTRSSDGENARGAMIQYWITFADGSKTVTEPFPIEVREWTWFSAGDPAGDSAHERLRRDLRAGDVRATTVSVIEEGR